MMLEAAKQSVAVILYPKGFSLFEPFGRNGLEGWRRLVGSGDAPGFPNGSGISTFSEVFT